MPVAHKLPSGSWRCQVIDHYEYRNGKKTPVRVSFTCDNESKYGKAECEQMAAAYLLEKKEKARDVDVRTAIRKYIDVKAGVLSPSTVAAYEKYLKNGAYAGIEEKNVRKLRADDVQAWVSGFARTHSAKYTKNVYGLFSAAVKLAGGREYAPTMPAGRKPKVYTPTDAELLTLLNYVADKPQLRNAILLAAFGSLRRSEICALTGEDFSGCAVTIKTTKTEGSDRVAQLPAFVVDMIGPVPGPLMDCNPDALSNRFNRAIKFSGVRKFSFHALRHYYVSIAHAIGISDAYTMKMGGWRTDHVMKRNYLSTLSDIEKRERDRLNQHFENLMAT